MKIDLSKGINIQIDGELGKYKTLPIDDLVKIAKNFQELIFSIAKYDLPNDQLVDLNNFKIELSGFNPGSAIPSFIFSPREENKQSFNWDQQRQKVNEKFEILMDISSKGDYNILLELYPNPIIRTNIVENIYNFANSFGTSPVHIIDNKKGKISLIYDIKRFKPSVKNTLIAEVEEPKNVINNTEAIASVRLSNNKGKVRKKIMSLYSKDTFSIEYAPEFIKSSEYGTFYFKYPLRCLFEKEDDFFTIHSEMLDIIAVGESQEEAVKSFSDEFGYMHFRLNSLKNSQLTKHNILIKNIINNLILKIEK